MVGKWQPEEIVTKSVILSTLCLAYLLKCLVVHSVSSIMAEIALLMDLMVSSIRVCAEVTSGKLGSRRICASESFRSQIECTQGALRIAEGQGSNHMCINFACISIYK